MNVDYRIICDLDNSGAIVPKMPLILAMKGKVGEAKSIRGLICLLIHEYIDAEDSIDDWNLRVKYARREAMNVLINNIDVVVYDRNKGVINNNYAAAKDDPDYEIDENKAIKIYVDSEKDFLMSLVKLGSIKIFEREDSFQLKQSNKVSCNKCSHRNGCICSIYKKKIDKNIECESGTESSIEEYTGGRYIEIQ